MSDTTNKLYYSEPPVDTKPSTDTDEIIEEYLKCLDNILTEDEDYNTMVYNNYVIKGEKYDDRSRKESIRRTNERN